MPPTRTDRRISARVRILLWLLLVMALAAVAVATRSILLRDVDHRINQLLTQETGEFANFVEQGVDPATGRSFTDPDALLRVFLQRQYSDPDEELLGLVGPPGTGLRVIRQSRDIPSSVALHRDRPSLDAIAASDASSGRLDRARARSAGRRCRSRAPTTPGPGRPSWWPSTPTASGPSPTRRSVPCSPYRAWRC